MPVKLSSLAVNPSPDGTWEDCPSIPGVSFLVRPVDHPAFAIAREHHMQRLRRMHGNFTPPAASAAVLGQIVAEHLLLDWRGFDEPYARERAIELLSDPSFSELTTGVLECAKAAATAKLEYVEAVAKN